MGLRALFLPDAAPSPVAFLDWSCPRSRSSDAKSINALVPGDVFVVRTCEGNYAKAVVTLLDPAKNHGLIFRWVTYAGQ